MMRKAVGKFPAIVVVAVTAVLFGGLNVCPAAAGQKKSATMKSAQAGDELGIGRPAPKSDLKMMDISGKPISLRGAAGKNGLLVVFSCNTCPFVLAWEDRYPVIAEKCKAAGIGMVAVNSNEGLRDGVDSQEEMKARAGEQGYAFPYLIDSNSELADAFGATRTPQIFLFDSKLKLVYRGAIDDNSRDAAEVTQPYLSDAIDAMADGKPVAVSSTKSIGCSIKRKKK